MARWVAAARCIPTIATAHVAVAIAQAAIVVAVIDMVLGMEESVEEQFINFVRLHVYVNICSEPFIHLPLWVEQIKGRS